MKDERSSRPLKSKNNLRLPSIQRSPINVQDKEAASYENQMVIKFIYFNYY